MSKIFTPINKKTNYGTVSVADSGKLIISVDNAATGQDDSFYYAVSDNKGNSSIAKVSIKIKEGADPLGKQPTAESTTTPTLTQEAVNQDYRLIPQDIILEVKRGETANINLKNYVKVIGGQPQLVKIIFEPKTQINQTGNAVLDKDTGNFSYFSQANAIEKDDYFTYTVSNGSSDFKTASITIKISDIYDNQAPVTTTGGDSGASTATGTQATPVVTDSGGAFIPAPTNLATAPNLPNTPWDIRNKDIAGISGTDNTSTSTGGAFRPNDPQLANGSNINNATKWGVESDWAQRQQLLDQNTAVGPFMEPNRPFDENIAEVSTPASQPDAQTTPKKYNNYSYITINFGNDDTGRWFPPKFVFDFMEHEKNNPETLIEALYNGYTALLIPPSISELFVNYNRECSIRWPLWIVGGGYQENIGYVYGPGGKIEYMSKYKTECMLNNKPKTIIETDRIGAYLLGYSGNQRTSIDKTIAKFLHNVIGIP